LEDGDENLFARASAFVRECGALQPERGGADACHRDG
jgi:hypothetical protein